MVVKYPCVLCKHAVKTNQKGLLCISCNQWVHVSCASIPLDLYNDVSHQFTGWECRKCIMKLLPFYESDIDNYSEQINMSKVNSEGQTDAQALPNSVKNYGL